MASITCWQRLLDPVIAPALAAALSDLPVDRIIASKEDLKAGGMQWEDKATVPDDFYERLVDDMMQEGSFIRSD
jgi:hypothetical protein